MNMINKESKYSAKAVMLEHGYIENDFDVREWAAPEFLEKAAKELLEEKQAESHRGQVARGDFIASGIDPVSEAYG